MASLTELLWRSVPGLAAPTCTKTQSRGLLDTVDENICQHRRHADERSVGLKVSTDQLFATLFGLDPVASPFSLSGADSMPWAVESTTLGFGRHEGEHDHCKPPPHPQEPEERERSGKIRIVQTPPQHGKLRDQHDQADQDGYAEAHEDQPSRRRVHQARSGLDGDLLTARSVNTDTCDGRGPSGPADARQHAYHRDDVRDQFDKEIDDKPGIAVCHEPPSSHHPDHPAR